MHKLFLATCCLLVLHPSSGLDAEALSKDSGAMQNFLDCILETGACSKEEDDYRLGIPDAVQTSCSKCDADTKDFFIKTTSYVIKNRPEDWNKLKAKYDPQHKYEESILRLVGLAS